MDLTNNNIVNFCQSTAKVWQLIGYIILILKILIPIVLIILGIIDLSKSIVSNDDNTMKKQITALSKKIISGIVIFFIPTIINYIFSLVGIFSVTFKNIQETCVNCVIYPNKCDVSKSNNKIYK